MARDDEIGTEELFEQFMQLDVDASGKISRRELGRYLVGDDLRHRFEVVFDTADTGISWAEALEGVAVGAIEEGSPAFDHPDCQVGLAVSRVNGEALAAGTTARTFRLAWQSNFHVHDRIVVEFFEPILIAHEFAKTLDIEIDESKVARKRRRKSSILREERRLRGGYLLEKVAKTRTKMLDALNTSRRHFVLPKIISSKRNIFRNQREDDDGTTFGGTFGADSRSSTTTATYLQGSMKGTILVTAKLEARAYAEVNDVERALGEALHRASRHSFDAESAVNYDKSTGIITIQSTGAPFRILGAQGPTRATSLHRQLRFPNDAPVVFKKSQSGSRQRHPRLGFRKSQDVRAFAYELLADFDGNNSGLLEFDEFRNLYSEHLATEDKRQLLRERVERRFRTEEEKRQLAKLEAQRLLREEYRLTLDKRREVSRDVTEAQRVAALDETFRDCDFQLRRHVAVTKKARKEQQQRMRYKTEDVTSQASSLTGPSRQKKDTRTTPDDESTIATTTQLIDDEHNDKRKSKRLEEKRNQLRRRDERLEEEKARFTEAERLRVEQEKECRRKRGAQNLATLGYVNVFDFPEDDLKSRRKEDHAACHPALASHAYKKKQEKEDVHPSLIGYARLPMTTPLPLAHAVSQYVARDLVDLLCVRKKEDNSQEAWRTFHTPPLCRGWARQHHRLLMSQHDRAELVHPVFYGGNVAKRSALSDAASTSPVVSGYSLEKRVFARPDQLRRGLLKHKPPIRRLPAGGGALDAYVGAKGGFDDDAEPCHLCLGGKLGCPFCFEFPLGFKPKDYAYAAKELDKKKKRPQEEEEDSQRATQQRPEEDEEDVVKKERPVLHTDLTTVAALGYRRLKTSQFCEILIKSVPCGDVVRLTVDIADTVSHVHHLFRSNSPMGSEETRMFLPTERGLIDFDVGDPRLYDAAAKIASPGTIQLQRYGLNKRGARAVIFHAASSRVLRAIQAYCEANLPVENLHDATTIVPYLDDVPRTLPDADRLQQQLLDVVELQERHNLEDRRADDIFKYQCDQREALAKARARVHAELADHRKNRDERGSSRKRPVADIDKLRDTITKASSSSPPPPSKTTKTAALALPLTNRNFFLLQQKTNNNNCE